MEPLTEEWVAIIGSSGFPVRADGGIVEIVMQPHVAMLIRQIVVTPCLPQLYLTRFMIGMESQLMVNTSRYGLSTMLLPPVPWCTTHAECLADLRMARSCFRDTGLADDVEAFRQAHMSIRPAPINLHVTLNFLNMTSAEVFINVALYGPEWSDRDRGLQLSGAQLAAYMRGVEEGFSRAVADNRAANPPPAREQLPDSVWHTLERDRSARELESDLARLLARLRSDIDERLDDD